MVTNFCHLRCFIVQTPVKYKAVQYSGHSIPRVSVLFFYIYFFWGGLLGPCFDGTTEGLDRKWGRDREWHASKATGWNWTAAARTQPLCPGHLLYEGVPTCEIHNCQVLMRLYEKYWFKPVAVFPTESYCHVFLLLCPHLNEWMLNMENTESA